MENAIGLLELSSVAKGFEVADDLLKAASSELVEAHSVCPGKFIILFTGATADVESSARSGEIKAADALVDKLVIKNIHSQLVPALRGAAGSPELDALGIIETFSAASAIRAADSAAKSSEIKLIDIRLANALGGKAYFTMTGEVAAVRSAVNAAAVSIKDEGMLLRRIVIAQPHEDLWSSVL